jgi:hypothetical protein
VPGGSIQVPSLQRLLQVLQWRSGKCTFSLLKKSPSLSACSQPFLQAAPILTIFVGGNHEAANHLRELYVPLLADRGKWMC